MACEEGLRKIYYRVPGSPSGEFVLARVGNMFEMLANTGQLRHRETKMFKIVTHIQVTTSPECYN